MCGIVGYIGNQEETSILLACLRELEYRGYDSAGIALLESNGLKAFKAVGKLDNLAAKVIGYRSAGAVAAIGHIRWATHGKLPEANAHPHELIHSQVVHNGIIENYQHLESTLSTTFLSQTDSEVIVHLFEKHLDGHGSKADAALAAFRATLDELHGPYDILLVSEITLGRVFFARKGSPLQIGFAAGCCYLASSDAPLLGLCDKAMYFEDGQWGVATADTLQVFDASCAVLEPMFSALPASRAAAQKEGFRYFMEKEIYEQPQVLADILTGRLREGYVEFDAFPTDLLWHFRSITLCACGTSYHAALVGSYLFKRLARVPVKVEIASEFRYRQPVLDAEGLFVVISQSGETADTLEALKLAKAQGLATLALCNVDNSSMVREVAQSILLRTGIEKGVISTKAFAAQLTTLWLLALYWGQAKGILTEDCLTTELTARRTAIDVAKAQPALHERIYRLSKRYLHAEGYPADEMKHGPIALADAELFTIVLMARTIPCGTRLRATSRNCLLATPPSWRSHPKTSSWPMTPSAFARTNTRCWSSSR